MRRRRVRGLSPPESLHCNRSSGYYDSGGGKPRTLPRRRTTRTKSAARLASQNFFSPMEALPNFALTVLGILFCVGDVAALGWLLEWRNRAAVPADRLRRLWRGVLPGAAVLVALLLLAMVQTMLLWRNQ